MKVLVNLHTILQKVTPEGRINKLEIEVPSGVSIQDLLYKLEISLNLDDLIIVVNGKTAQVEQKLNDNDTVHLIPAIAGG